MAKARLSEKEIEQIVGLLTGWSGKLSWELLLRRAEVLLRRSFTRQGLDKNTTISTAFRQAKSRLRTPLKRSANVTEGDLPPELALAQRRIDNLVAEVEVLKAERDRLLERFATWLYNARSRGISEFDLNRKLPDIDRDSSERKR